MCKRSIYVSFIRTAYAVTLTSQNSNSLGVADIIAASADDNKIRIFKNTQTVCLKQTYVPVPSPHHLTTSTSG